jgi:hypothetical protein
MTSTLTRGGLVPAKIVNLSTNEEVLFMFNPHEYKITKNNTWTEQKITGQNLPKVIFSEGGAPTLHLTLHFDTLAQGSADVQYYTAPLWKMVMIDTTTENARTHKGTPPPVAFEWGRLYFKAIITSINENFTLFTPSGVPIRSTVEVDLKQFMDIAAQPPQVPEQSTQTAPQSTTAVQGDRLDHIAARTTGDASNYREVAEANNIDNPMQVRNGQTLNTP